ncbi:MAG: NUDIX hydrolase [Candidatus Thorarchaeota archaeon]
MAHDDYAEELATLHQKYGVPRRVDFKVEMLPDEFALVQQSMTRGRQHDVTIFIQYRGKFVVIEKHAYAKTGIVRAPSGGAQPAESLIAAAQRESLEETGFDIQIDRFVLESHVLLKSGKHSPIPWVSYVFLAHVVGGKLGAKDIKEISDVQLRSREELLQDVRPLMLASGLGGFEYRAKMTDAFFAELDALNTSPK